jgi:hypothetical protein
MSLQNYYEEEQRKDLKILKELEDNRRTERDILDKGKLNKQIEEVRKRIQERDNYLNSSSFIQHSSSDISYSPKHDKPSIRFDLISWTEIFRRNLPKDSNLFINKNKFSKDDESILKDTDKFLETSLKLGLDIELYDSQENISLPVKDNFHFWAILISSLSIFSYKKGYLKWLIKVTYKSLKKNDTDKLLSDLLILSKAWQHIFERYCNSLSRHHKPEILREITSTIIDYAEENNYSADFLYRVINFLYKLMGKDKVSIGQIANQLDEYDKKLGNDAAPKYLQVLKRLVGTGINTSIHGLNKTRGFETNLVRVQNPSICDYEFESMAYTITVLDYAKIRGISPRNLDANLKEPHVFKILSDNEKSLYNLLSAEIF